MQLSQDQLAIEIEQAVRATFRTTSLVSLLKVGFGSTTITVKQLFGDLGKRFGYKVAAAGYPGADDGEWLYDMVWYTLENGFMIQQNLVLESELNPDPVLDGDFQKLVQARADVRVWVSCSPNKQMAEQHITNCRKQAVLFSGALHGDTYIFVTDNWTTPSTTVERFVVANLPHSS
jgi:hypothetical protein